MRENKIVWPVWYCHCTYIRHGSCFLCCPALIVSGAHRNAAATPETSNGALTSECVEIYWHYRFTSL